MPPQSSVATVSSPADASGTADGFLPAVTERLQSYVYLLIDPRDDRVFHVGIGTGDRCFAHLAEARSSHDVCDHVRIREIEAAGKRVRIDVLRHGLDAATASVVQAAVIDALAIVTDICDRDTDDDNTSSERVSVGDLNARYGATPIEIDEQHPVVLVRIPKAFRRGADHQRYEMTRGWWRAGARRELAQWAFAVDDGVVRAVYRIDAWEPARAGNRWGFRGHRDPEMEQRYVRRDVSDYLPADSLSALHYVNC